MASQAFGQSVKLAGWNPPDYGGAHTYHIYHTMFHHDYNILANGTQLLHVDNSSFTPGKPDLTFHAGTDKNAPVVSVCKFGHFWQTFKVGFGDPKNPNNVVWEDLASTSLMQSKYRVEVTISSKSGGDRRSYLWKNSLFGHDLRLIDEKTGAVVAMFNSNLFSFRKSGRFEIYKSYDPDFDLMALTTGLGLAEKQRRREAASGGGGGDGGG
jgi:hypothetical protein